MAIDTAMAKSLDAVLLYYTFSTTESKEAFYAEAGRYAASHKLNHKILKDNDGRAMVRINGLKDQFDVRREFMEWDYLYKEQQRPAKPQMIPQVVPVVKPEEPAPIAVVEPKKKRAKTESKAKVDNDNPDASAKPPVVPVRFMNEAWDVTAVEFLQRIVVRDPNSQDGCPDTEFTGYLPLKDRFTQIDGVNHIRVGYGWREGQPRVGRWVADGSCAMYARGISRRYAQGKFYHDIDQVNSGPVIVWNLCSMAGIRCPVLDEYVQYRKEKLEELQRIAGITSKEAKLTFQSICFGKGLRGWLDEHCMNTQNVPFLTAFSNEIANIRKELLKSHTVRSIVSQIAQESELSQFATVIQDYERLITEFMIKFFESHGYTVGAYIADGIQVRRKGEPCIPERLLKAFEVYIYDATKLKVQIIEKCMESTPEDLTALKSKLRLIHNETDAAYELMLQLGPKIIHVKDLGIGVFDDQCGVWSFNQAMNEESILTQLATNIYYRFNSNPFKQSLNYFKNVQLRARMFKALKGIIPVDPNWMANGVEHRKFKLCFMNGYWDFKKRIFCPGLFPEMCFLTGVKHNLVPEDAAIVQRVRDEMFSTLFDSTETRDYFLKALSAGLAGDTALKKFFFLTGETNSGKSTLTRFMKCALNGVVGTFNIFDLCKEGSGDANRDCAWMLNIHTHRLIFSNEGDLRPKGNGIPVTINNSVFKNFCSGGNDDIFARDVYEKAKPIINESTGFSLANDAAPFSDPSDVAVQNRAWAIAITSQFVDNPVGPNQFKKDKSIETRIMDRNYQNGLVWLLIRYYQKYETEGHVEPPAVIAETELRVPREQLTDRFVDNYDIWSPTVAAGYLNTKEYSRAKRDGWAINTADVFNQLKPFGISEARAVKEFAKRGVIRQQIGGPRYFLGLRKHRDAVEGLLE